MPVIEKFCTITAKGEITVPQAVCHALGVGYGDRISFRVEEGSVTVHKMLEDDPLDPALTSFLVLLEADIAGCPATAVLPLTPALAGRMESLMSEIETVDLDAVIENDVAL